MSRSTPTDVSVRTENERARELRRVASELFFSKGYEATTTREIASVLGIKSASIYYHYDNKEEILFDVIRSTMAQLTMGFRDVVSQEPSAASTLVGLVANHVAIHALRPRETTLGDTELRSLTGPRRARIVEMRDQYDRLVVGVLKAGANEGVFECVDPKLTAYAVIAQSSNVGGWYRTDGRVAFEEVVHVYANLALRQARAPDADHDTTGRLATAASDFHAEASS